jgi:hypothetical protein
LSSAPSWSHTHCASAKVCTISTRGFEDCCNGRSARISYHRSRASLPLEKYVLHSLMLIIIICNTKNYSTHTLTATLSQLTIKKEKAP